jgi:hypothetical protein
MKEKTWSVQALKRKKPPDRRRGTRDLDLMLLFARIATNRDGNEAPSRIAYALAMRNFGSEALQPLNDEPCRPDYFRCSLW